MKYLFVICVLLIAAGCYSPEPVPTCSTPSFALKDVPISLKEIEVIDLNNFFTGFNLEFEASASKPDWVHMTEKFKMIKQSTTKLPGLKSYHLDHIDNGWGSFLVVLTEEGSTTKVRWGKFDPRAIVPNLGDPVVVENKENIICFDAAWLDDRDIIMVDCAQKSGSLYKNIFLYVNTSTSQVLPDQIPNDMYVPFQKITRRKIQKLSENGYHYLIRAYFSDSVDDTYDHDLNTYLEIMVVNDHLKPWTFKVMDRSFLHQDKLAINDFKIYLGDLYILDEHSGVTRFDISPAQNIIITGRYRTDSGFVRMGVFSSNYDNEILLVLANRHAIYEVDWTNQITPKIIAKYSLMDSSHINSLSVNEQYVVAQVSANVSDPHDPTIVTMYNATMVFSRGTRTYLNAYAVASHRSENTFLDFNRNQSLILSFDQEGIRAYQVGRAQMYVMPSDNSTIGTEFKFSITGRSVNPFNGHSLTCSFTFAFTVVPIESLILWPTGLTPPEVYHANYPGQLFIPLANYVLGPNITWGVQEKADKGNLPNYWILQQNSTVIHWNKQPSMGKITFLRQEQYDSLQNTDLYIYTQDIFNRTHFAKCHTTPFSDQVNCSDNSYAGHINETIANLTANRFHYYEGSYMHLAAVVYQDKPNDVFIYDVEKQEPFIKKPLHLGQSYEGRVTGIEFIGPFLAIVLKYTKEIVFYDMIQCRDSHHDDPQCKEVFRINSLMMDRLGVIYFSPIDLYVSDHHPTVVFVQCLDKVVILDFTRRGPIVLGTVQSPGTSQPGHYKYKMAVARDHLVLVNPPNIIQEHSLQEIYTRHHVELRRVYPTYNYTIPDNFDLDFSDNGNMVYITAVDPSMPKNMNSVVLVYRSGYPSVSSFYDVFNILFSSQDVLIDATGNFGDYVAVATGSILQIFRQYAIPMVIFEDTFSDFQFNLTFTNDPHETFKYLSRSMVKVANYPEDIYVTNPSLNQTDYLTKRIVYKDQYKEYKFWDHDWFNGSVLNYSLQGCSECGNKFKVINHLEDKRDVIGAMDMRDYVFTIDGGIIQQNQGLIKMRHNGSLDQFVTMPSVHFGENCAFVTHSWFYEFDVSACSGYGEVYLYVTTTTASKPFVQGPFYSSAKFVTGIQIVQDIFIVVDVDPNPYAMNREGGVLIYAINHDPFQPEVFDELQFIDSDDLVMAQGWPGGPAYISNAHLVWTNSSSLYRLVLTEVKHGIFVLDFKYNKIKESVEITKISYVDVNEILNKNNLPLPNMAYFQGITVSNEFFDSVFKYWELEIILTTRNFHMFQLNFHVDTSGTVVSTELAHVFYRYGFYETANYIKSFDGYFVVVQQVPILYQDFDRYSKQVLTVYDTRPRRNQSGALAPYQKYPGTNINASYMLGGMVYGSGPVTFDFNFTFVRNHTDPFRDLGLLVLHAEDRKIRQVNINDELTIITKPGIVVDQNAVLRAQNDFSKHDIKITVLGIPEAGGLPGWAIALIVLGSLAIAGLGGFVAYRYFIKKRLHTESEVSKSLLEQEADDVEDDSSSSSDDDADDEQDDEVGEVTAQRLPKVQAIEPPSINRETISSTGQMDNEERIESPELPQNPPPPPEEVEEVAQQAEQVQVVADAPPNNEE